MNACYSLSSICSSFQGSRFSLSLCLVNSIFLLISSRFIAIFKIMILHSVDFFINKFKWPLADISRMFDRHVLHKKLDDIFVGKRKTGLPSLNAHALLLLVISF